MFAYQRQPFRGCPDLVSDEEAGEKEEPMSSLSTTVAVYDNLPSAEKDWGTLEEAASLHSIDLADAALVQRDDSSGDVVSLRRQEHHGWGKGAVAGAVVGLIFPPSIVAGAVVGGLGGGLVGRISRCFNRGDIKELGEAMDRGEIAIVVVSKYESVGDVENLLSGASHKLSRGEMSAAEVQTAIDVKELNL
jgi:uncharacterized membrane protein